MTSCARCQEPPTLQPNQTERTAGATVTPIRLNLTSLKMPSRKRAKSETTMTSQGPLDNLEPRPIDSPSLPVAGPSQASEQPKSQQSRAPEPGQGIALRLGPEAQIPDHPSSMVDVNTTRAYDQVNTSFAPPPQDLRSLRTTCQYNFREYLSLQGQRRRAEYGAMTGELDARIGAQAGAVLGDLKVLQSQVRAIAKAAENHRWRRWLFGGALAMFIPLVRKLFRRRHGDDKDEAVQTSSNDTEYAFQKSKGLLSRIKDGVLGKGGYASLAFFVFAVLYVFQNEVSLRIAKTVQKRIKKLCDRFESGQGDFEENDLKLLEGWRWRILLW